jgi:hypothetical protein
MLTSVRYSETGRSTSFAELKSNTGSGCKSKSYYAQNPSEENQTPDTQAIALEGSHPFYPKCHNSISLHPKNERAHRKQQRLSVEANAGG